MTIYDDKTIARFWQKVDRRGPDECWEWQACLYTSGYGKFRLNKPRRFQGAHVVVYEMVKGQVGGYFVCHSCDNPKCCNPNHLWLGDNSANIRGAVKKGRLRPPPSGGEHNGNAKLTYADVEEIRHLLLGNLTQAEIGHIYGITHSAISLIKRNKTWVIAPS